MSVQAGVLHFNGMPVDHEALFRMSRAIADFGPDGEMTHFHGSLGMLYRPLHTTSESRAECQPFIFSAGRAMTWDGRLDNREELRAALGDRLPAGATDVDIVAASFEQWGRNCLRRLVGDWALSIWDPREQELVLARDCMGIRQLFYYPKSHGLLWCTYLSPLAQCGDTFTVCDEYVAGYLAFQPDAHLTPYREIRAVPPGTFVRVRNANVTTETYWTFNPRLTTRYKTDREYEEHYSCLFRQSVRRRLRADTPILAALSGGLDSTSIVCMADDIVAKEGTPARVDTISYYDPLEPDEDDLYHLTKVEEKRGRKGIHLSLAGRGDSLSFEYPAFVATPGFGVRAEVKSSMSTLIRQDQYRVMLNGTGGDEMNAQALSPLIPLADLLAHFRFRKLAKQLVAWSLVTRRPFIQLLFESMLEVLPLRLRARLTERGRLQPWVNPQFAKKHTISARQLEDVEGVWFWRPGPRDAMQTITTMSRDLTYTAPSRLEQRYPYLDQQLVEFLTTIPFDQLIRPGERRFLMRRALSGLLPLEVLERKTKVSNARCYPITLEKHWQRIEQALISPLSSQLGYLNGDVLRLDLLRLKHGQIPNHLVRLLKALSLEFWLRDVEARRIVAIQASLRAVAGAEMLPARAT